MEDTHHPHNSGLVILAPFLPRYFDMLGMLETRIFRDETAAIRAVLLLEYLASGRTGVAEQELVFNKLLCGLPVSTPVPTSIELSGQEIEASRQMLNAVLQNWDKMSSSSVENLRGSFLLRTGLLLEHEDHCSLRVESAGYDIILRFLPWTISVVSLSWMGRRLEVEWSTPMI
jgi:hypothetical protein